MSVQSTGLPHILMVDDNPDQLRLLVETLRKSAYRLTIAFDGTQGYARAVAMAPDLILLDMRMPKLDGLAVARMLKANPATEHIPIIFLTASGALEDRLAGLRSGAVDYIVKPIQPEEVLERVRIHLSLAQGRVAPKTFSDRQAVAHASPGSVPEDASPQDSRPEQVLQRAAARIILDRLESPPRAMDLAAMLGVSERRIVAAFESCIGLSIFEFIRRERMRKAARLLSQTTLNILDIATEVGYSSAANFTTAFKEFWGQTPSAFRKQRLDVL